MKRILPINDKPLIRSYTYHGYFHSVISAPDKVVSADETVTEFVVTDYASHKWNCEMEKVRYERDGDHFFVYGNQWNLDMNMMFWRPCQKNDSIEINILKQVYTNIWGSVFLYLTKKNTDMHDVNQYDIRIGNFSKDGVFYISLGVHNVIHKCGLFNTIQLIRNDSKAYMEFKEGKEVTRIDLTDSLGQDEYQIGFAATFACNSFYEWTFSNYVNVYSNFNQVIPFDFLCNSFKNWNPHSSDYFMEYQCESVEELRKIGYSELDFVKFMLRMGRYVEVEVNDNLNIGIPDENGPFFHHNFIYGFDDEESCLSLLYVRRGHIVTNRLTYKDFESPRNYQFNRKYFIYKYDPGYERFTLDVSHLLCLFKEFKASINISNYGCVHEPGYSFGLNSYRALLSDDGITKLVEDIRISHLLYERTMCNESRVEYLLAKFDIRSENVKDLLENIHSQLEKTMILRNLILKKNLGGKVSDKKLKEMISIILDLEERITDEMITFLKDCS